MDLAEEDPINGPMGASEQTEDQSISDNVQEALPKALPTSTLRAEHQRLQLQNRIKIRQQKLKVTICGYLSVLTFFALLQIIGVVLFTQGFLLSRTVLPDISDTPPLESPVFDKMVLIVIDALRFDFVIPVENSDEPYHNELTILHELATKNPENAFLLKFLADPPTTTLQRLKGLTTGSLPTFIDAGSNFDGDAINEDNWILQLHKANKCIAFTGDDTWKALFSHYIEPTLFHPFDSLNVWDLHTVDDGVISHMTPWINQSYTGKPWDIAIGHLLGLDHVGHRYGPNHPTARTKLRQMNEFLEYIISNIDDNTLMVVMGDHGMDSTGNHGGDSPDELESTLFMYSKHKNFRQLNSNAYNISEKGISYRSVNQIDLVPTLSLLLGVPIPFNNLGFPIEEAFKSSSAFKSACKSTINQICEFVNKSEIITDQSISDIKYQLEHLNDDVVNYIKIASEFQAKFLDQCKDMWATFDLKLIVIGCLVLFLSSTFIITYSRLIPAVRVSTMSFEFIGSVIAMSLLGLVASFSIHLILRPQGFLLRHTCAIGASCGIFIGLWAPIMDRFSVAWLIHQMSDFFIYNFNGWSTLGIFFIVVHSVIFASNSFVVWEDKMVSFFILSFGFYCLAQCIFKLKDTNLRILAIAHTITFILLSRVVSMINICREEQGNYCTNTFKVSWWSILLLYVVAWFLPAIIKQFYQLSDSYYSAAPAWIGSALRYLLLINAIYWSLDYITSDPESIGGVFAYLLRNENVTDKISYYIKYLEPLTASIKRSVANSVMFITFVVGVFNWSQGPLCVKLSPNPKEKGTNEEKKMMILGINNAYGSSYVLLLLTFAVPIMIVNKPIGIISLCMLLVQILSILELFDILVLRDNIIAPTMLLLLAYQHFFSTGHQATISSIQWDVGFITTETITFPFTHLNIVLNTFGSFILVCLSIPLLTLWKIPPSTKPITVLSQVVANITSFLSYQTVISVSSFIFAGNFRRHLMVWKIFAPRYMLSGMLLILMNILLITLTLGFATARLLTQVNRIFGK